MMVHWSGDDSAMNSSHERAETVIIGGGIVGLATAWQLQRRGHGKTVVLERAATVGAGSTGASSAICRHLYSRAEMVRLARDGINAYRGWRDFTQLKAPRASFHNDGVLWFSAEDDRWLEGEPERLAALGVAAEVLDSTALRERFPAFNACSRAVDLSDPENHDCGGQVRHLYEPGGGYMDPVDAAADLVDACRAGGVSVRFNSEVREIGLGAGRVQGVTLAGGERIACESVVNAAGPWCARLYETLGLPIPMPLTPVRIQVLYVERNAEVTGPLPVCADLGSGIYFRTQNRGQQIIVGSVREEDERERVVDPDNFLTVADEQFCREKLHLLQHRIPALRVGSAPRSYCGLYTVNEADVHPIVGPYGPEGLYVANGFSGHGFKAAPAIGAMLARQITGVTLAGEDSCDDDWLLPTRKPIDVTTHSVLA